MTREEMLTEMIRIYGFEHKAVIRFAQGMEDPYMDDATLMHILRMHQKYPMKED